MPQGASTMISEIHRGFKILGQPVSLIEWWIALEAFFAMHPKIYH
jgi:hypothetical protein